MVRTGLQRDAFRSAVTAIMKRGMLIGRNEVAGDAIQATGLLLMLISSGRLPFAIAYYKTEKVTASQLDRIKERSTYCSWCTPDNVISVRPR